MIVYKRTRSYYDALLELHHIVWSLQYSSRRLFEKIFSHVSTQVHYFRFYLRSLQNSFKLESLVFL